MSKETAAYQLSDDIRQLVEDDRPEMLAKKLQNADKEVALMAVAYIAARAPDWVAENGERMYLFIRNMDKNWSAYHEEKAEK